MITDKLKGTLQNNARFLTLSLCITLFDELMKEFFRLGISPGTLSFLSTGAERISEELKEGKEFISDIEEFDSIIKNFKEDKDNDIQTS